MGESGQTIKKFTFDTEFRGRRDVVSEDARARARLSLTREEVEDIRAKAYAEGLQDGQVRAAERTAAAIENCAQVLGGIMNDYQVELEVVREKSSRIALSVAHKLAGAALEACPEAEIEVAVRAALTQAVGEAYIVLRAAAPVVEALGPRLEALAKETGFRGTVSAMVDPALGLSDCRVEWQGGGLERSQAGVEAAIDELVERRFFGNAAERAKG